MGFQIEAFINSIGLTGDRRLPNGAVKFVADVNVKHKKPVHNEVLKEKHVKHKLEVDKLEEKHKLEVDHKLMKLSAKLYQKILVPQDSDKAWFEQVCLTIRLSVF